MDTVGMENLSSAAAQGEQASEPHHANGYNFTGADPNVRTLEDAVRHGTAVACTVTIPHMLASISLEPVQHHPLCSSTFRAQIHRHTNHSGAPARAP